MQTEDERAGGRKRRTSAAAALKLFRARAKAACGTFSSVNEWFEFLSKHLEPVLKTYEDTLSVDQRERLHDAAKVSKATRDGVNQACHTLDNELGTVIDKVGVLSTTSGLTTVLVTGAVIAVVVVGAIGSGLFKGIRELVTPTVEVRLVNGDCTSGIPIIGGTFAGVSVPTRTLRVSDSLTTKLPDGLSISVGPSRPAVATVRLLLLSRSFDLPPDITWYELNGRGLPTIDEPLTSFSTVFHKNGAPYTIALSCQP